VTFGVIVGVRPQSSRGTKWDAVERVPTKNRRKNDILCPILFSAPLSVGPASDTRPSSVWWPTSRAPSLRTAGRGVRGRCALRGSGHSG
jgi:hypothetical protein